MVLNYGLVAVLLACVATVVASTHINTNYINISVHWHQLCKQALINLYSIWTRIYAQHTWLVLLKL